MAAVKKTTPSMQRPRHLLVDVSAHGYGHASMTAPVVNELARRFPGLRVTLRTAIPHEFLQKRLACDFHYIPAVFDFGMTMANALDVQATESMDAYRAFHRHWDAKVEREADALRALKPDLLLANVPYLSLAAARKAGIPASAMCCLNWADIYHYYAADNSGSREIHEQMLAAYNSAAMFLRVQPAMPMNGLGNIRSIGPIARVGFRQRELLAQRLSLSGSEKVVLVGMGGIDLRLPMERWPRFDGVRWLVPRSWNVARDDISVFENLGMPFSDVLASCDAVLTKPGYGTFSEAACAGVPVLYVPRGNWPEEPYLVFWLQQNGACRAVERAALQHGVIHSVLEALLAAPRPVPPLPSGTAEAADYLSELI
jgi:hypothetical protein